MPGAGGRSDRGETLIEVVVAVAVMSTAMVAVVGGLGTAIMMSDIHRKQATAGVTLRNYAEAINRTVDAGGYPSGCAALSVSFTPPAGFSTSVTKVGYWSGSAWSGTCSADSGLRQLTLQVASSDSRAVEQLVIEVRKPCGLADALCG
jgi:type II secretory pathway pseudopilin PulG